MRAVVRVRARHREQEPERSVARLGEPVAVVGDRVVLDASDADVDVRDRRAQAGDDRTDEPRDEVLLFLAHRRGRVDQEEHVGLLDVAAETKRARDRGLAVRKHDEEVAVGDRARRVARVRHRAAHLAEVGHAVAVGIDERRIGTERRFLRIGQPVVVRVGVEKVRAPVEVGVRRTARRGAPALLRVRQPVAVRVVVSAVGAPVAVRVGVAVERVRNPVSVGVGRRVAPADRR